jgi:hypothetical protein
MIHINIWGGFKFNYFFFMIFKRCFLNLSSRFINQEGWCCVCSIDKITIESMIWWCFFFSSIFTSLFKKKKTKSSDFYKSSLPQFISLYNKSLRVHKILYYDVVVSVKWYASKLPLRSLHRLLVPFLLKNYLIELLLNVCVNITRWTRIFGHQWCRVKWLFMRYFYPLVALFVRINH